MFNTDNSNSKALNEVIEITMNNCYLQVQGIDVAVPYITGAPGGGKTASIKSMCEQYNWGLVSTHFALKPLEETGGIPQFENVTIGGENVLATTWSFPDIMKQLYLTAEKYQGENQMVIWLLDDMHLCSAVHNAMLYELLTERKLREFKIPDNVALVLAGNHASNKAGAKTMFSAIINRVAIMPIYSSFENWKNNFAIQNKIHPAIISFLENNQYRQFFHEEEQVDVPWGSPRSWSRLSNVMCQYESWYNKMMRDDMSLYMATSHIGKDGSSEFNQYYQIFSKFDIPSILKKVDDYKLPENPIDRYALAYALTSHYCNESNKNSIIQEFAKIMYKYINTYEDLGLMMIHEILNIEKVLKNSNLFIKLAAKLNEIEPGITKKLIGEVKNV